MRDQYEINLSHGEIKVEVEYFSKEMRSVWGGQDVIYKFFVKMVGGFDEVEMIVSAFVKSEPFIELEFNEAEPFDDKDFILGSTGENEDGFTNTTAGEMVEELVERHELLEALTDAFYR